MKTQMVILAACAIGAATVAYKAARFVPRRVLGLLLVLAILSLAAITASAQTDPTAITTSATAAFVGVATLCVSIGTFFIGYRIIKKIK